MKSKGGSDDEPGTSGRQGSPASGPFLDDLLPYTAAMGLAIGGVVLFVRQVR